jgi:hypothetical protein
MMYITVAAEVGISNAGVFDISTECLRERKVSIKRIPCLLRKDQGVTCMVLCTSHSY